MVGRAGPGWAALARRLVEHETGAGRDVTALAEATERACWRLHDRLVPLIGADGFRIMLANAVDLTRTTYPFLQAVDSRAELNGCFERLGEVVRGRDADEALAAFTQLLAEFVGLLGSFVGDALTWRLVRGAWPEIRWQATAADKPETTGE